MLLYFLISVLLPATLVLVAPREWARAVAGWGLLAAGLVFLLDHLQHPAPYDDDFLDIDLGLALGTVWASTIVGALVIRRALLDPDPLGEKPALPAAPTVLQWLQCWSIPIAFLVAAAFLHWLSNRLAGASPAWQVHLRVLLPALCLFAFMLRWVGWRGLGGPRRLGLALPVAFSLLVAWDGHKGFDAWSGARSFAAGRPYCLMTYGGFEHRRTARSGWDLSPLVDRHYGDWAVGKTPTLAVATDEGIATYRLKDRWRPTNERPQCRPA
jgi:hypothetical protein